MEFTLLTFAIGLLLTKSPWTGALVSTLIMGGLTMWITRHDWLGPQDANPFAAQFRAIFWQTLPLTLANYAAAGAASGIVRQFMAGRNGPRG